MKSSKKIIPILIGESAGDEVLMNLVSVLKTKRIFLNKKESEVDYKDKESGIELKFDRLIPRDSDI